MHGLRTALVLCLLAAAAHAAPWEQTRKSVIDPLNSELHRHLPTYVRQRDLDAVVGMYETDVSGGVGWDGARQPYPDAEERISVWDTPSAPEPVRARWQRVFALLAKIDKAELRIDRIGWRDADADGYPAEVHVLARGWCADGTRCELEQWATLRIRGAGGDRWHITREEIVRRQLVQRDEPRFEDVTAASGVASVHANDQSPPFQLFGGQDQSPVRASAGVAVADVDGDGREDVFLAGDQPALYRNGGDGTFTDVTAAWGLPRPWPGAGSAALFFDYDRDGRPDLLVGAVVGGDRLFHNAGDHFEDVTARAGIPARTWTGSVVAADYDRDGWLDVYLVGMGDQANTVPTPNHDAANGTPGTLLRNRGDGTFQDVTAHAGVAFGGWGLAAGWADYDDDGWPDLYVSNEFGRGALFHNDHDGTFTDVAARVGADDRGAGMAVAWGDFDGDGDLDLYVSHMHANSGWALFHPDFPLPYPWWTTPLRMILPGEVVRRGERYAHQLLRGSTLLRNDGGHFTDVSDAAGVRDAQWGWSAAFVDYDDDGRLDIYAADGFISGPLTDDT